MKQKKRLFSLVLAMMMAVSLMIPASAVGNAKEALYAQYQQMIAEANARYGFELSLFPLEYYNAADMSSAEEFRATLDQYCQSKLSTEAQLKGESFVLYPENESQLPPLGIGPITRSYVAECSYGIGTVSAAFTGTFHISQLPNGVYYVSSYAFLRPTATSTSPNLSFVYNGDYTVRTIDAGETYQQRQNFYVHVNNEFYDTITISAYFYFDKTDGSTSTDGR